MDKMREEFDALCNALPDGVSWGDPLTVDIAKAISLAAYAPAVSGEAVALTVENAPVGTKAPAIMGGRWYRTAHGWKWNGPDGSGGTFPRPGGDWVGELIAPDPAPTGDVADPTLRHDMALLELIGKIDPDLDGSIDDVPAASRKLDSMRVIPDGYVVVPAPDGEAVAVVELSDYMQIGEQRKVAVRELHQGALKVGDQLYTRPAPDARLVEAATDALEYAARYKLGDYEGKFASLRNALAAAGKE